jgi:ribA/ribD-fused uncharacterized protein
LRHYERLFAFTGAIQIKDLCELSDARSFFYTKDDRFFLKGEMHVLRGPRYLAALDPRLSIPQKLSIFIEDIHEGFLYIQKLRQEPPNRQHKSVAPVLDYVKNGIITLTNAFLRNEKRGKQDINEPSYADLKSKAVRAGRAATYAFYSSLIGEFDYLELEDDLSNIVSVAREICAALIKEYERYSLSSRDIVRPEATHPLILLAFTSVLLQKQKDIDTVIGLPSGGTEIAYLISEAFSRRGSKSCDLVLLPVSLHSMYALFREKSDPNSILPKYWKTYKHELNGRSIVLVDDNSSSGSTVSAVVSSLKDTYRHSRISFAVAEADIYRTQLDLNDIKKRSHYADPSVYSYSVGILPVSKKIWRKHDLKEVMEAFSVGRHYYKHARNSPLLSRIKNEVFSTESRQPFERLVCEPGWEETKRIERFKDTFLSNFHIVPIAGRGNLFASVEHAYQSEKFDSKALRQMPAFLWNEIEQLIGRVITVPELFVTKSKSGSIKKVANLLSANYLRRDNWDERRVNIMVELLVAKFTDPEMRRKLLHTRDDYLIEGNDWGDTFWGACYENGRMVGRNILGLILMNIRDKLKAGIL